jgi:hypothetical protein
VHQWLLFDFKTFDFKTFDRYFLNRKERKVLRKGRKGKISYEL